MFPLTATNRLQHGAEREVGCCWVNSWYDWSFFRNSTMWDLPVCEGLEYLNPHYPLKKSTFSQESLSVVLSLLSVKPKVPLKFVVKVVKGPRDDWFWNQKRAGFIWPFCFCCFFLGLLLFFHMENVGNFSTWILVLQSARHADMSRCR